MADATDREGELIARMQTRTAKVKILMAEIEEDAGEVAEINHKAGNFSQSADAMKWRGAVMRTHGKFEKAHAKASKALIRGYDNGEAIVAAGPIRGRP